MSVENEGYTSDFLHQVLLVLRLTTTGKTSITVGTNGKTSSLETNISIEQKIDNTKMTQNNFL